jgi:hypothetical protein
MLNSNVIKIYGFYVVSTFSRKTYSYLEEHQCSTEHSLGNAAVGKNTKHLLVITKEVGVEVKGEETKYR